MACATASVTSTVVSTVSYGVRSKKLQPVNIRAVVAMVAISFFIIIPAF